jgi:hypothetical protein
MDALLDTFLKGDAIRSRVLRDDQARATFLPDEENDMENVRKIKENLQTLMMDHFAKLVTGQMYDAILQSTSRALVLRALQTGLRHAECKKEAFRFLRDPSLQLSALPTSLKEIETNVKKGPNGGGMGKSGGNGRYRINAMGQFVPDEEEGLDEVAAGAEPVPNKVTASPVPPTLKAEIMAAIKEAQKDSNGRRNGGKKNGQGRQSNGFNGKCHRCKKAGHKAADCNGKKASEN